MAYQALLSGFQQSGQGSIGRGDSPIIFLAAYGMTLIQIDIVKLQFPEAGFDILLNPIRRTLEGFGRHHNLFIRLL